MGHGVGRHDVWMGADVNGVFSLLIHRSQSSVICGSDR
jgi:hypothetical protein